MKVTDQQLADAHEIFHKEAEMEISIPIARALLKILEEVKEVEKEDRYEKTHEITKAIDATGQKEECIKCKGWACLEEEKNVKYCSCDCHKKQPIELPEELEIKDFYFGVSAYESFELMAKRIVGLEASQNKILKHLKSHE